LFDPLDAALADISRRLGTVEAAIREFRAAAVPSIPQSAIRNLQWKVAQVYEAGFHIVDRDGAERHGPEGLVPILGRIAAGPGAETLEAVQYEPGDAEAFLAYAGAPAGAVAVRVVGRSMEPEFREGDLVIVDPGRPTDSGLACVIQRVADTEVARLKKIRRRGRRVILESTAGGFAAEELPADALVGSYAVIAHLPLRRSGGEGG
jgi:SOS-response transcriptional repressor LexA